MFLFFFPFFTFCYIRLCKVRFGFILFSYITFGSVSLHSVTSMAPTGMLGYFLYPHIRHTSPQSLCFIYISHHRPSYPFNPAPAHNITACDVCINTDEVLCSFVVICAPQADKITNYLPLFERSSFLRLVSFVINRLYGLPSTDLNPTNQPYSSAGIIFVGSLFE